MPDHEPSGPTSDPTLYVGPPAGGGPSGGPDRRPWLLLGGAAVLVVGVGVLVGVLLAGGSSKTTSTATTTVTSTPTTAATVTTGDPAQASGVAPAAWARTTCGALEGWSSTLSNSPDLSNTTDLQVLKAGLVGYLSKAVDATDKAIGQLTGAGEPAVPDGGRVADAILTLMQKAKTALSAAQSSAQSLPTDNPGQFATQADALARSLKAQGNDIDQLGNTIASRFPRAVEKLDPVFAKTASCRRVGLTSSGASSASS